MGDDPPKIHPAPGPYYGNVGPLDGPARHDGSLPSAIGLALNPDRREWHDGIAFGRGYVPWWRGPVATWRLSVRKVEVPGLFVLVAREFVPLDAWRSGAEVG